MTTAIDPSHVRLRRGVTADAPALAEFAARAFTEAFGALNTPQNLQQHLAHAFGVPQQTRELESGDMTTVLACVDDQLVGYAQVRRSTVPDCVTLPGVLEIYRFYLTQAVLGQGIGQRLMAAALAAAREMGGTGVWLSVWENSPRARAFYARQGFRDVGSTTFRVGDDLQHDRVLLHEGCGKH